MASLVELGTLMQGGRAKVVRQMTNELIAEGFTPKQILEEGFLPAMAVVGEKFKNNEVFVPEVLIAARAMNAGMEELRPFLQGGESLEKGTVVLGTVRGDLHDIGKNIVGMMMKGSGLKVIDLGTDVAPETFVSSAIENNAKVIACSSLLTTTMKEMGEVVKEAEKAGIRSKVKIMVGGAPVTQAFCDSIGADRYTPDATSAAEVAVAYCN
ncbi:MAG: corrinoid protein [Sphaerochaetaceae bacterium]|nr:corrinoid protein [Sphaerochaetaceae bacterium]